MAIIGLFLNWLALRQNNRIAVSSKIAEASKLLSDELLAEVRSWKLYQTELREAKEYSVGTKEEAQKKINSLELLIENSISRQSEIDRETAQIESMFSRLDQTNPGKVDAIISKSYRLKAKAVGKMQFAMELKNREA